MTNQGLLKSAFKYILISFAALILFNLAILPTVSNDSVPLEQLSSFVEKNEINKIIKDDNLFYIEVRGEKYIYPITKLSDEKEIKTLLFNNNIQVVNSDINFNYPSLILYTVFAVFLLFIAVIISIIQVVFKTYEQYNNDSNVGISQHFNTHNKTIYKDAIQNLLKVSNTNFGTTSLFLTTILFLSFTYFTLPEQQLGAPNTYLYSDLITDIKSNNVSYVEISIDSDVSNIKISKENTVEHLSTGDTGELKSLLSEYEIKFNEINKGTPFNFTPYVITLLILLSIFFIMSKISKSKNGFLQQKDFKPIATKPNVSLDDVKGIEEIKDEISEVIELLNNKVGTNSLGGETPRGILIDGAPGVGKTLLAKAIANETNYNFFYTNGSEFAGQLQGQGAGNIKALFKAARENQPAIIFIDEIDGVGQKRGSNLNSSDNDRTLNGLLVELDGFDTSDDNILVIGATNFPDKLDPALIRAGRFDREITIPLPKYKGRLELLKYFVGKVKASNDIDLNFIAHHTSGFSGASLKNLVNEAALLAGRKNKTTIDSEDFEEAQSKLVMGHKLPIEMSIKEKWNTAYHEAGHVIVSKFSDSQHMKVHKVSIIPRGRSLGVTVYVPEEESYSISKKEIEANISALYGGRIAEELVVGENEVSTGASNDFARATQEAEKMIKHFGLNSSSLLTLGYKDNNNNNGISENDKKTMEEILLRNYVVAAKTLSDNKVLLREFAKALMLFDTIESDQIARIMTGEDITISNEYPNGFDVPEEYDVMKKTHKIKLLEEKEA